MHCPSASSFYCFIVQTIQTVKVSLRRRRRCALGMAEGKESAFTRCLAAGGLVKIIIIYSFCPAGVILEC